MDTQKIQSTLEFKAFMQDLLGKSAEEIMKMPEETFKKFLVFCKELIDDFDFPFSFYYSYDNVYAVNEFAKDLWISLVELEADMKCRIYPGTKLELPYRGRLKHTLEYDRKIFLIYLLSACGKNCFTFAGLVPDTRGGFPSEKTVQWTSLMKLIRNLGIG